MNTSTEDNSSDTSPNDKSRYGRTRKPKIAQDFCSIDDIVIEKKTTNFVKKTTPTTSPNKAKTLLKSIVGKSPNNKNIINNQHEINKDNNKQRNILDFNDFDMEVNNKLDNLEMRITNNFKSFLQRTSNNDNKERKFFKREKIDDIEQVLPTVEADVTKVFKLITTKTNGEKNVCDKPIINKTTLKTYTNKRKPFYNKDYVESFGLPDEPIIPIDSPVIKPLHNEKIDISTNLTSDISLIDTVNDCQTTVISSDNKNIEEQQQSVRFNGNLSKKTAEKDVSIVTNNELIQETTPKTFPANHIRRSLRSYKLPVTADDEVDKLINSNDFHENESLIIKEEISLNDNSVVGFVADTSSHLIVKTEENDEFDSSKINLNNNENLESFDDNNKKNLVLNPFATNIVKEIKKRKLSNTSINLNDTKLNDNEDNSINSPTKMLLRSTILGSNDSVEIIENNQSELIEKSNNSQSDNIKVRGRRSRKNPNDSIENIDIQDIKREIFDYQIGDLAWAKIGSFPYWPCLVTPEPNSEEYKKVVFGRVVPIYHIRFFGDNGRRAWVSGSNMMLYTDKEDLKNLITCLKAERKASASFIRKNYKVKARNCLKWRKAVEEAVSVKAKAVNQRLKFFSEMLSINDSSSKRKSINKKDDDLLSNITTAIDVNKKNVVQEEEEEEVSYEIKQELIEGGDEIKEEMLDDDIPIESSSHIKNTKRKKSKNSLDKNNTTNSKIKQRKLIKRNSNEQLNTTTCELTINNLKESEEIVENLLTTTRTTTKMKNKKSLISCENSSSDTDSKFSDNSSVPVSLESQAELYRRNNIFRGISRDKVCQICEKPGEVFKCKGRCSGVYHYKCAMQGIPATNDTNEIKIEEQPQQQQSEDDVVEEENSSSTKLVKQKIQIEKLKNVEIISIPSTRYDETSSPVMQLNGSSPNFKELSLAEQIDFRMKEIMKKFDYKTIYPENDSSSEEGDKSEEIIDLTEPSNTVATTTTNQSELLLVETPTKTPEIKKRTKPIIKHVTADNVSYHSVTSPSLQLKEEPNPSKNNVEVVTTIKSKSLKNSMCGWCMTDNEPPCLICNEMISKSGSKIREKCSYHRCGKYYHLECLKSWPQTQWSLIAMTKHKNFDTFVCPRHFCHTCASDDPRAAVSRLSSDKVVKCLYCPATYHSLNDCVPAGTNILSTTQIICPRHYKSKKGRHQTINTTWCFICAKGGDLICCETCPTSVHVECLHVNLSQDDNFICEDCETGRLPLYDEIVWVKLGTYRWWPALILFPNEIPERVRNLTHNPSEFVVKFFGTYDHYWVSRGRTFLFQEGDRGHSNPIKKRVDSDFIKAVEEATAAHQLKKQFKIGKEAEKTTALKPAPYIRIKSNKPVGNVRQFDGNISNTTSCECDPNEPYPCGPDTDCLNRLLLTECNSKVCPAGDRCNNQCFEKREYPPLLPYRTQARGWGLKTLTPIRKGQFVIEYIGELIDEQEYQRRIQKMHQQKEENYYFLTIDKDRTIDAGPKGNVARFMNHSCQPNCETQKWTVNGDTRVGLFAKEDIAADMELTFNYNLECIGKEKKICKCGAANCSGFIGVKVKTEESQKKPRKSLGKSKKKKLSSSSPVYNIINENLCFICGKVGDVGPCNNKICTKYYHLECLNMSSWPKGGKWVCPWHNCNICSKRTIRCCVICINSYCPTHSDGNVRHDKWLGFVCSVHDPVKETHEIETTNPGNKTLDIVTDETAVTSTTLEEDVTISSTEKEEELELEFDVKNSSASTPLKQSVNDDDDDDNSQDENIVSSATLSSTNIPKNKGKKRYKRKRLYSTKSKQKKAKIAKIENINTANNIFKYSMENEVKLTNFTPTKYLRTSKDNLTKSRTDLEKDLPIRKRTRLRCENNL